MLTAEPPGFPQARLPETVTTDMIPCHPCLHDPNARETREQHGPGNVDGDVARSTARRVPSTWRSRGASPNGGHCANAPAHRTGGGVRRRRHRIHDDGRRRHGRPATRWTPTTTTSASAATCNSRANRSRASRSRSLATASTPRSRPMPTASGRSGCPRRTPSTRSRSTNRPCRRASRWSMTPARTRRPTRRKRPSGPEAASR